MWSALCVDLSEILEVRGSGLTEEEAWVLLYEIGRQLKNVPTQACRDYVIVPENIQLHRNGGLSIRFTERCSDVFPDIANIEVKNVLVYSLGMTVLCCLQKDVPDGEYLNITEELHSVLAMMTSPGSTPGKLEKMISHTCKFGIQDWEHSVSRCFKSMYKSIFGSTSNIEIDHSSNFESLPEILSDEHITHGEHQHFDVVEELGNRRSSPVTNHSDIEVEEHSAHLLKDSCLLQEPPEKEDDFTQTEAELSNSEISPRYVRPRSIYSNFSGRNAPPTSPTSMLHSKDAPILVNLCTEKSDFKNVMQVTVEYLDGKKLRVNLEFDKTSCGHLLELSVSHLVTDVDPTAFCLTILRDGEYLIASPTSIVNKMLPAEEGPHFYLRLRFLPRDINSIQESNLLQAMYLQTRKDLLDGFTCCNTEEALLLAAYSLQYEIGNAEQYTKPFRMRDFVPVTIIDRHGSSYLRTSLSCLHARLTGTEKYHARTLYLQKATELLDFGTHLMRIFMNRKCHISASAWLSVGHRGLKIFHVKSQNRTILHNFSWDQLTKLTYKGTVITLAVKSRTKLKFYVKKDRRSKYITRMIGETHQYHRFDDFQGVDQFFHPTSTSTPQPHLTLPFLHKKQSPSPKIDPERRQTETPLETKPLETFLSAPGAGSQISLSSGHPQITPFETNDQNSVSELAVSHTSESGSIESTSEAEVFDTPQDVYASIIHEESPREPFDPNDIPPPIYEIIPDSLRRLPESNREAEQDTPEIAVEMIEVPLNFVGAHDAINTITTVASIHPVPPRSSFDEIRESTPVLHDYQSHVIEPETTQPTVLHRYVDTVEEEQRPSSRDSHTDTVSRGEGDGISTLSGPDQSLRHSSKAQSTKDDPIPEAVSSTIADFEEFKRRLSRLKSANESSSGSEDSESWSGKRS